MVPELRDAFNAHFTERKYAQFCERMNHRFRTSIQFRICETPCFVPGDVQRQCEEAAVELTLQAHSRENLDRSSATLKQDYTVAGDSNRSTFMTVDFAMTPGPDGSIAPRLIEMQGFPSLMGFQLYYAELAQEHWGLPTELTYVNGGYSRSELVDIMHRAIVGDEDIENVVLLELDPWNQKTCPDFHALKDLLGINVVDIRSVKKIDRQLHYDHDGRLVPIRRIFNRAIVDELQRSGTEIPFNWHDDLDVVWAGHPNWYFRISKFTLPFLHHPLVPRARFLDQMTEIPADLNRYVLKPLYSFAGVGVIVGPTLADIETIPASSHGGYLLQERIEYKEVIKAPVGGVKVELRVMLIWLPEDDRPRPVMGLARMGRGKMMGVDFNRDFTWVGSGCNLFA